VEAEAGKLLSQLHEIAANCKRQLLASDPSLCPPSSPPSEPSHAALPPPRSVPPDPMPAATEAAEAAPDAPPPPCPSLLPTQRQAGDVTATTTTRPAEHPSSHATANEVPSVGVADSVAQKKRKPRSEKVRLWPFVRWAGVRCDGERDETEPRPLTQHHR
jgi:hypothetical protein